MKKLESLQKKHPKFIYESFNYKVEEKGLKITFDFLIEPDIRFRPKIIIENVNLASIEKIGDRELNNFIFHLGMMEIPSYWKAACSPEIIIRAGYLNKEQVKWWQDLILNGMGQFYYENKIPFQKPAFNIAAGKPLKIRSLLKLLTKNSRVLVPVGGGKDSIVTLEKLKAQKREINCFLVNPSKSASDAVKTAGIENPIVAMRKIDPVLLKLNEKGYLNGHTPFTAMLSFLSVFCALLFDYKNIAFSNEKSANEGNTKYLGKTVNHQWAKSSEFERKFKNYCKKYLTGEINYSSYLRKYTELEISKMFVNYPQYFSIFSSCNISQKNRQTVGSPEEKWCANCPKCLFVYMTLYPFLRKEQLLKIFGRDIFENKNLLPVMKSLLGQGKEKPFECVGTFKESRSAFKLSLAKAKKEGSLPYLLTK